MGGVEDVLLSPDGTMVVDDWGSSIRIVDLVTGTSRELDRGEREDGRRPALYAVAWAPDSKSMLAFRSGKRNGEDSYALVDLTTKAVQPLGDFKFDHSSLPEGSAAFSPDGQRIALFDGAALRLLDRTGATLWSATLADRTYLSGVGAFSPDGQRIATVRLDGCLGDCDAQALAARRWTVGQIDAATGQPVDAPNFATMTGLAVSALGWTKDQELVMLRYLPGGGYDRTRIGHVALIGLRPDGSTRKLLDPPAGVLSMDIARDLVVTGRFGGPSRTPAVFPVRSTYVVMVMAVGVVAGLVAFETARVVVAVRRWLRRRQPAPVGLPT